MSPAITLGEWRRTGNTSKRASKALVSRYDSDQRGRSQSPDRERSFWADGGMCLKVSGLEEMCDEKTAGNKVVPGLAVGAEFSHGVCALCQLPTNGSTAAGAGDSQSIYAYLYAPKHKARWQLSRHSGQSQEGRPRKVTSAHTGWLLRPV